MGTRASEILAGELGSPTLEVVPGCGHWVQVDAPDAFVALLGGLVLAAPAGERRRTHEAPAPTRVPRRRRRRRPRARAARSLGALPRAAATATAPCASARTSRASSTWRSTARPRRSCAAACRRRSACMDRIGGIAYEREPTTGCATSTTRRSARWTPKERLARLDLENLERAFLYPTLGVLWEAECEDEELDAGLRARLQPLDRRLLRRLRRAASSRSRSSRSAIPRRRSASCARAAARRRPRRLGAAVHADAQAPSAIPTTTASSPRRRSSACRSASTRASSPSGPRRAASASSPSSRYAFFLNVTAPDAVRHAFTSLFQFGVFDRFPQLRVVVLESGAGWIGYWLDRMDAVYALAAQGARCAVLTEKPSVYFRRQCWISADPDETTLAAIIPLVGEDRFFWASDFPHPDHPPEYIPGVTRIVRELPESARAGFLGANALRAYRLG